MLPGRPTGVRRNSGIAHVVRVTRRAGPSLPAMTNGPGAADLNPDPKIDMGRWWMSLLSRHRRAAVAAGALFLGAPLLFTGPAHAEPGPAPGAPVQESGQAVVFSGDGLLGVACGAKPDVGSVTVPAESTLRVVNNTGRRARLLLDGSAQGEIASGATADVLFRRGPVQLALKPVCVLSEESAVRVEVAAAPPPQSTPGRPTANPTTSAPGRPPTTRPVEEAPRPPASPRVGATPSVGVSATPSESVLPTPDPGAPVGDVPLPAAGLGGSPADPGDGAAAEPMASVEPVRDTGPIGLLALVATVCVVGVSAGAIRAIIAQRTSRTAPA
ncbi:hypothetical protein AB0I61_15320 [Polymorphospora rubra]|uniref:hypothetical protein n=1 Tax=Polymorphospora rubra TaxID=338584 RepID=UPI0033C0FADA